VGKKIKGDGRPAFAASYAKATEAKESYDWQSRRQAEPAEQHNYQMIHWPEAGMVYKNRDKLITIAVLAAGLIFYFKSISL
jgi:hypothetical protein